LSKNIQTELLSAHKKEPRDCCGQEAPEAQQHRRSAPAKSIFFEDQERFLKQDRTAMTRSLEQRVDNPNRFFGVFKSRDTSIGPLRIIALSEARAAQEAAKGRCGIGSIVLKA
jgi:hypothetical protein